MLELITLIGSYIGPMLGYALCLIIAKAIAKRFRKALIPSDLKRKGNKLISETSRDVGWHRIPYEWTKIKNIKAIEREKEAYFEVSQRAKTEEQKKCAFEFFIVKKKEIKKTSPTYKTLSDIFYFAGLIILVLVFLAIIIASISIAFAYYKATESPSAAKLLDLVVLPIFIGAVAFGLSIMFAFLFKKSIKTNISADKMMSLDEYEQLLSQKIEKLSPYTRSLKILGLDETQVEEIKPVTLSGYLGEFVSSDNGGSDKNITMTTYIDDKEKNVKKWVSSSGFVSYWFFTDTQILVYSINFDMCASMVDEITHEVFYEDICDICVLVENQTSVDGTDTILEKQYVIKLTTPNSTISFSVDADEHTLSVLQGLKQKIRENKQSSIA